MERKATNQFTITPNQVIFDPLLQAGDTRIYAALRSYRNEDKKESVFPSKATIAAKLGCSEDTIARAIERLTGRGHVSYVKGVRGYTNRYQFRDDYRKEYIYSPAGIIAANIRVDGRTDEVKSSAPAQHQPEPSNQNNKPERSPFLFHGKDKAFVVDDGSIRIKTHSGQWVDYGGGDDANFRFGGLQGVEARKAAIKHFCGKTATLSSLPTSEECPNPSRPTIPPFDNLNND